MSRLQDRYRDEVIPALRKEFGYTNVMAVPKIERVVVNMGLGEATQNAKLIEVGADELSAHHRSEAGHDDGPGSRSRSSRFARVFRLAPWSRYGGSGCMSSSTG